MLTKETAIRMLQRARDGLHSDHFFRGQWIHIAPFWKRWRKPDRRRIAFQNQINRAANALGLRPVFKYNGPIRLVELRPIEEGRKQG